MIPLNSPDSKLRTADWVELNVAVTRRGVSRAHVASVLEGETDSEPDEAFLNDVWTELIYREPLYSVRRFRVSDRVVEPAPRYPRRHEYVACLLLSLYGVDEGDLTSTKLFESLSCAAAGRYLAGRAVVFGAPVRSGQTPPLRERFHQLARRLGETLVEPPRQNYRDRGVDVVSWLPFAEGRSGQVVLLIQCAAGRDWGKPPVPLDAWRQYLKWAHDPIRGYAVPSMVPQTEWHDRNRDKGVIFDRARIVNLLSAGSYARSLTVHTRSWVQAKLRAIQA